MTQNETPQTEGFEIRITPSVLAHLQGTSDWEGEGGEPDVTKELHSLSFTKKGAHGTVSYNTLGWLLTMAEGLTLGDSSLGERTAATKFVAQWEPVFRAAEKELSRRKAEKKAKPSETSNPQIGKPVFHVRTGEIVGYLYQKPGSGGKGGKFTSIEEVRE